ncbi:MAG TPA: ribosome silencing factor [Firmicutes bacterium]|nr:ribosome silencing factor [Bacillota bacterium]
MLKTITNALSDKKAIDITVLDVSGVSVLWTDFVICSGTSETHIRALRDNVEKSVKESGGEIYHKDTGIESGWIIIDSGDILIHIFDAKTREYYSLERLWGSGGMKEADMKKNDGEERK